MEAIQATARARKPTGEAPEPKSPPFKPELYDAMRTYRMYGLEPVYADKACTAVVSIEMLLKMGWKIAVVGANQFQLQKPVGK